MAVEENGERDPEEGRAGQGKEPEEEGRASRKAEDGSHGTE